MTAAGSNGPPQQGNVYDSPLPYDAPVDMDTGLFSPQVKSLADYRRDMMIRLGYAAMLANPPPGMKDELNSYLQDAQEQLYLRYTTLRTMRWWGFNIQPGVRLYDVPIGWDAAYLDFRRITWAGIADDSAGGASTWYPLSQGINPEQFSVDNAGHPTHFELREWLEIWPTPDKEYKLWLKGHMGLRRFTEDTDEPTIDGHIVWLFALANAKNHRGQPDAGAYAEMANRMIREMVAGTHGVTRYIPRPSTAGMKLGALRDDSWCGPCAMPDRTWD